MTTRTQPFPVTDFRFVDFTHWYDPKLFIDPALPIDHYVHNSEEHFGYGHAVSKTCLTIEINGKPMLFTMPKGSVDDDQWADGKVFDRHDSSLTGEYVLYFKSEHFNNWLIHEIVRAMEATTGRWCLQFKGSKTYGLDYSRLRFSLFSSFDPPHIRVRFEHAHDAVLFKLIWKDASLLIESDDA